MAQGTMYRIGTSEGSTFSPIKPREHRAQKRRNYLVFIQKVKTVMQLLGQT